MTFNGYFRITTTRKSGRLHKLHEELRKNEDVPYFMEVGDVGGYLETRYTTWLSIIDDIMKILYKNNWTTEEGWLVCIDRKKNEEDTAGDWNADVFIEEGKPHCEIREAVETIKWVNKGDILENIEM